MVHHRWIIIISAYIVETIAMGLFTAFPVLFLTLLETFTESRERTATTTSVLLGVSGCTGIINGIFVQRIGPSRSGSLAGLLMGFGWMVSFFSTSILYLDLLLAVPMGIGTSVVLISTNTILSHLFTGYARIIALSIQSTAAALGRLIFVYLLTACGETFGLKGTFLIMGAVLLNCCIIPILWQIPQSRERRISKKFPSLSNESETTRGKGGFFLQCPPVLTHNIFIIFCIGTAFLFVPHNGFIIVFTDIMKNQGLSDENITLAYLIHSISNLLGRIYFGVLEQVPRIGIMSMLLLNACMSIISFATIHVSKDVSTIVIASFFFGFEFGATVSSFPIGTLKLLGIEHMSVGMGFLFTLAGVGNVVVGPIFGRIRDSSGSYAMSLWISTLSAGIAAILFLVALCMKRRRQRTIVISDVSEHVFTVTQL